MLRHRVNGYDMAYSEVGEGEPLVCIHGTLNDFRVWSPVLGLLSRRHRVITPSLRRFFPEHWDGVGDDFTIAQHVADVIAFLEALGGAVNLLGHSRGGDIAFRVARQRPDLVLRLVLAEPGGRLDASLAPKAVGDMPVALGSHVAALIEAIRAGEIESGLALFFEAEGGPGAWRDLPAAARQQLRDNARTLLGQVNEGRRLYSRADAEGIRVPTLFVGGANTTGRSPIILHALAAHVPGARVEMIPDASHMMFVEDPVQFSIAVLGFLAAA